MAYKLRQEHKSVLVITDSSSPQMDKPCAPLADASRHRHPMQQILLRPQPVLAWTTALKGCRAPPQTCQLPSWLPQVQPKEPVEQKRLCTTKNKLSICNICV